MAELKVTIRTQYIGAGITQAAKELTTLKDQANTAAPSLSGAADQLDRLGGAARTAKDGLEIANGNFRGLPGLLREASDATGGLSASLARVGLVAGAFTGGFKLMSAAADSFIETMNAASDAAAAFDAAKIEEAVGRVNAAVAAFDKSTDAAKRMREETEANIASIGRLAEAQGNYAEAVFKLRSTEAAGRTAAAQAGAKTSAEATVAGVTGQREQLAIESAAAERAIQTKIEEESKKIAKLLEQRRIAEEKLTEARQLEADAKQRLSEDPQDEARVKAYIKARDDSANKAVEPGRQVAAANEAISLADDRVATLNVELQAARAEAANKGAELQRQSIVAMGELTKALEDAKALQAQAAQARAGLQVGGNASDFSEAFNAEQAANAEVARLQKAVAEFGGTITGGLAAVADATKGTHTATLAIVEKLLAAQVAQQNSLKEVAARADAAAKAASNALGQQRFKTP